METNQLLINYYKKEEIKKAKQRQMEGLSNNEIINLANKTYITEEEIKQYGQAILDNSTYKFFFGTDRTRLRRNS